MGVRARSRHFPKLKVPGSHASDALGSQPEHWWRVTMRGDGQDHTQHVRARTEAQAASLARRSVGGRVVVVSQVAGPQETIDVLATPLEGHPRAVRVTVPIAMLDEAYTAAVESAVAYLGLPEGTEIAARATGAEFTIHTTLKREALAQLSGQKPRHPVMELGLDLPAWMRLQADLEPAARNHYQGPR